MEFLDTLLEVLFPYRYDLPQRKLVDLFAIEVTLVTTLNINFERTGFQFTSSFHTSVGL
jgi:hypothetical protein